jgi:hypothetical protein
MDALNLHLLVPRKGTQMAVAQHSIEDKQDFCWWHTSLDKRSGAFNTQTTLQELNKCTDMANS